MPESHEPKPTDFEAGGSSAEIRGDEPDARDTNREPSEHPQDPQARPESKVETKREAALVLSDEIRAFAKDVRRGEDSEGWGIVHPMDLLVHLDKMCTEMALSLEAKRELVSVLQDTIEMLNTRLSGAKGEVDIMAELNNPFRKAPTSFLRFVRKEMIEAVQKLQD